MIDPRGCIFLLLICSPYLDVDECLRVRLEFFLMEFVDAWVDAEFLSPP